LILINLLHSDNILCQRMVASFTLYNDLGSTFYK